MVVITGHNEYGNRLDYMIFTVFDILKKGILKVEKIALGCINKGIWERNGFPTIPNRN